MPVWLPGITAEYRVMVRRRLVRVKRDVAARRMPPDLRHGADLTTPCVAPGRCP